MYELKKSEEKLERDTSISRFDPYIGLASPTGYHVGRGFTPLLPAKQPAVPFV
jgi:hypothetical protein